MKLQPRTSGSKRSHYPCLLGEICSESGPTQEPQGGLYRDDGDLSLTPRADSLGNGKRHVYN